MIKSKHLSHLISTNRQTLVAIALIFLAAACGTLQKEKTFSKNGLTVSYRSLNRFGREIIHYKIHHPVNLSTDLAKNHLLALYYRRIDPPSGAKPIFSKADIGDLSPLIVKAFKKVKPGNYLHFEYHSPRGITEGDAFSSKDKIYWRFLKINGEVYSIGPFRILKPTWKLARTRGQRFQKIPTALDPKSQENWLIANFNFPKIKRSSLQGSGKSLPADHKLRENLQTKALRSNRLIG